MRQAEKVDLGSDNWTMEIRPYASAFHFPIKELWEYRDLLFLFVRRDFKTMYKQTILGPAWILLSPLLTTGMFSLIFGRIAGISTDGTPAFLFYMAGNILWNYFSSCLSAASSTFIGNAGLFGKVYFPRIVVPASSAVSKLITFGAQFLLFLAAFIKGVDEYQEMLRCCVSYPGNDHRLGGNEAPPAIVSIFLGDELTAILRSIIDGTAYVDITKKKLEIGVDTLPELPQDTTDRNRTSPLAFTGNKFEFRMPGSAQNLSDCDTILNTAVAKELKGYADELEGAEDFTSAAIALIKRTIRDHRRVIFNGNGYTAEWEEEAARRGLPNKKNTPAALPALIDPKNIQLMEDFGVLTKIEMESRYEVEMEHYSKIINIEALTMLEMARKQLLPAINAYMSEVANTAASKLAVSEAISVRSETKTLTRLSTDADAMSDAIDALQAAVDTAEAMTDESAKAVSFHDDVLPKMDALRAAADDAETICGEDYWPLPSYSKMLYYV